MSLALHYWMGDVHHCSGPPISEKTYTVSSGTLNSSIPYPDTSGIVYIEIIEISILMSDSWNWFHIGLESTKEYVSFISSTEIQNGYILVVFIGGKAVITRAIGRAKLSHMPTNKLCQNICPSTWLLHKNYDISQFLRFAWRAVIWYIHCMSSR